MAKAPDRKPEAMTIDELKAELKRLKDSLCDIEDTHAFTFGKTTVHIGAEMAQSMQQEFEDDCRMHHEQIARVEALLKERGAA